MLDRREFLIRAPSAALLLSQLFSTRGLAGEPNLRAAAQARGIEIGAMLQLRQAYRPGFLEMIASNFTLAANLFDEMEWGANPGFESDPTFDRLSQFLDLCQKNGLRPRARQIYAHENRPPRAHLRADGTPKNKAELEKTLLKRVEQVCKPLKGRNAIIQVIDEVLAHHEGGLRKDPFADALGEEYVDILFHAAHEAVPDALLTYFDGGPEVDEVYFKQKTRDHLALLERLRKRNVPITGAALGGFSPSHTRNLVLKESYFKAIENLDYDIHLMELSVMYDMYGAPRQWFPKSDKENDSAVEQTYLRTVKFLCQFKRLREITFFAPVDGDNTIQTGTLSIRPYAKARPGIFNSDLTPKPVYYSVTNAVMRSKPVL